MKSTPLSARKTALAWAATVALGAWPGMPALSATCTWNPATGNWSVAGNWSCGIVPSGGPDTANIGGGKVVTINTAQSVLNLNNSGGVNIDAFSLTLAGGGATANSGIINVGSAVAAALQVSAGHHINNIGGLINIASGSVMNQLGNTITGGTIKATGTGGLVATGSNNFLSGVTLEGALIPGGFGTLVLTGGSQRVVSGLTLNGADIIVSNGNALAPQGNQTIGGTGRILLGFSGAGGLLNVEAGNLVLGSGISVGLANGGTHSGTIGNQSFVGGAATLTNQGLISADVSGGFMRVGVNGAVINQGTMQAQNGGQLVLNTGGGYDNSAGVLFAGTGSSVLLNGAAVTGGALDSAGTGVFKASNSGANHLNGVTLSGVLDLASAASVVRISAGGMTLNGRVDIGAGSVLAPQGNQTIAGNGTVALMDPGARLTVEAGNLVLGPSLTVRGSGVIGQQAFLSGAATLTNNGTIAADVAGGAITIQVNGLTTNTNTLAALNGGTLNLNSAVAGSAGSQILAGAGSVVAQNGVTISGVVNTTGTGSFRASNSGGNFLDGVSFSGTLDLASAVGVERVINGLSMSSATVNIGSGSVFAPQGNQTLSGSGTLVFADGNAGNRLNVEAGNLVIGPNVTVRGERGIIGQQAFAGGAATLTNNGSIAADVAGGAITIQVSGLTTNNNTLAALNGGTLNLNSAIAGNSGSQIVAGAGSVVAQNGITISGDMNLSGAGSFRPSNSGSNILSGVTLSGTLDLAVATGVERVAGGLTLNSASILIGSGSVLAPQGNQTLGGNGTIIFADGNAGNRLNVEAGNLILGAGITVRGGNGIIGQQAFAGGAATLTNQGLISADVAGTSISLGVAGAVINQGTMRAQNGGQLTLNLGGGYDNSAGQILADVGSKVLLNGTTVSGGVLNSNGSGVFTAAANANNFLNGVTLGGVLDMASAVGVQRISGGMTLNGSILLGLGSVLAPQGNQTIAGSGSIVFADGNGSNRLNVEAGNLVLGSGVTVRGRTGVIGQQAFAGGAASLTNHGTINSDGGGSISITVSGPVINHGLLRAQSGSLTSANALTGSGTLQVDAAGVMTLANSPNAQGRLVMGNAGSTLNIGTQNLTIATDYTNAAAGSGNSFDRRAGISGAGKVMAGGDVNQVISGANVSGGATPSATLTINNVRVGATTYDYQVGNAGSTGPTLRGAIQTSVNGANISDARLSGVGVTAANYSAGAPGGSSGTLGVTFTVSSAGALAPLTGQALNLRSNFENIADQKLNIVLGAGAAAYNAAVGSTTPAPVVVANQRVGGSNLAALTVTNTAAAGAFSEDLIASFGAATGAASHNGAGVSGLLAGASNASSMKVGIDTSSAGAKSGTVTLNYQTAGAVNGVSNGLGVGGANAPQVLGVSGNVYRLAQPNAIAGIDFGNVLFGTTQTRTLSVSNLAAGDGFSEALNAAFGSFGGANAASFSGSGAINGLLAGNTDNTSLVVTLNTSSTGTRTANVQILLKSNGDAIGNGLGLFDLPPQVISLDGVISGTVGNLATAGLSPTSVNFGKFREGTVASQTQALTVSNLTVGPGEGLHASFGASTGGASHNGGSITSLATNSSNNSAMSVTLNGLAAAGAKSGSQVLNFVSDGSFNAGVTTTLPSQSVNLSAEVYRLAAAGGTGSINLAARRVGDAAASGTLTLTNTAASDGFSEGLRGSIGAAPAGFAVAGAASTALIAAGGSESRGASLSTASAGSFSGNVHIALVSNGTGTSGFGDLAIGNQSVALQGKVYNPAQGQLATPTVDFGVVRVGDTVSARHITINNIAPDTALNDTLRAALTASGPVTGGGAVAGIVAGGSGTLALGLNTGTAALVNQSHTLSFLSQNPDMADASGGADAFVNVLAQINNLANADFDKLGGSGTLTQAGSDYVLDLGEITVGALITSLLHLDNDVLGPADDLSGAFAFGGPVDFDYSGWSSFTHLGAGAATSSLSVSFTAATLGLFSDEIVFSGLGTNASDTTGLAQSRRLVIRAHVVEPGGTVPEPGSLALCLAAVAGAGLSRRRRGATR